MKYYSHKSRHVLKSIFVVALTFACFNGLYSVAHAQSGASTASYENDFVLEPGKVEIFVNPGETVTRSIYITNRVATPVKFKVETEDFVGSTDKDRAVVLLGDEKSPYSFKDSLIPSRTEFTLNPGEKIGIPITISVPANAQPGGFYSSVLVSNQPSIDEARATSGVQGQTKIVSRVGALFLIRVNGPVEEKGFVEDFRTLDGKSLYSTAPRAFQITFQNDGTVHLVPYGMVTVKNLFGRSVGSIPVDAYFALPKSLRYRDVVWNSPSFLFGRYTANLEMHRGYGSEVDNMSFAFWVIPWKVIIIIFVVLLVVISVAYLFFSRFELRRK